MELEEEIYFRENGQKMSMTQYRKVMRSIQKDVVPPEAVISHYTKVTQLEIRLKNIAIHQIEIKRHEKAKEMLRETIRKIIREQCDEKNQK